ncbi:DUF3119 family protein [filamentous cyanobacterium LEGE 11480]|uniref:DUF3119 family protein n=1 Tax=Romeriopsis navalis LEGE 11480 TaxID=2777977 RepID=A0A928VN49_9CYAN|nr:DUF3119 family protein [Romeriopsis navalis]MBE9030743.1 DUF3119 family protein [Romeriopsis navalis LEGE 11480]
MTSATPLSSTETVTLQPSYNIPIGLVTIAIGLTFVKWWIGLPVGLFGLFLLIQTVLLKLTFTPTALDIYRGETLIRQFPFAEWQNWEIFWGPIPILFYFREVKSIHFLPIIFDPTMLRICLEQRGTKMTLPESDS